jgi:hypothetical protein
MYMYSHTFAICKAVYAHMYSYMYIDICIYTHTHVRDREKKETVGEKKNQREKVQEHTVTCVTRSCVTVF